MWKVPGWISFTFIVPYKWIYILVYMWQGPFLPGTMPCLFGDTMPFSVYVITPCPFLMTLCYDLQVNFVMLGLFFCRKCHFYYPFTVPFWDSILVFWKCGCKLYAAYQPNDHNSIKTQAFVNISTINNNKKEYTIRSCEIQLEAYLSGVKKIEKMHKKQRGFPWKGML